MRRLGERSEYGRYLATLGRCVHDDYHLRVFLAFGAGAGRFDLEKTTERGAQLPARPRGRAVACLALTPTLGRRGFRPHDKLYWRQRAEAWEIVAVLAVDVDVLASAEAAGAVDARALAWARGRGLVG